jgi:hypothetical protein
MVANAGHHIKLKLVLEDLTPALIFNAT